MLTELFGAFRQEEEFRFNEIERLIGERRKTDLALAAHSLAGSCTTIGSRELPPLLMTLEKSASEEAWARLPALLETVRAARVRLLAALNWYEKTFL